MIIVPAIPTPKSMRASRLPAASASGLSRPNMPIPVSRIRFLKYIVSMPERAGPSPIPRNHHIALRARANRKKEIPTKISIAVKKKWSNVKKPAFFTKSVRVSPIDEPSALFLIRNSQRPWSARLTDEASEHDDCHHVWNHLDELDRNLDLIDPPGRGEEDSPDNS